MTKEELLMTDYENTQKFIDKSDGFLFWIRNGTIVLCSAVIVFAVKEHLTIILICNILIITGFLFSELIQKSFHEDAIARAQNIEEIIQNCIVGDKPFPEDYQFGLGRSINTVKISRLVSILLHTGRWHNVAFYILILLISLATIFILPLVTN